MVRTKGGADRASRISRSGLNPDIRKDSRAQQLSIGDAVECHAPRHAEFTLASAHCEIAAYPQHRFIEDRLDRCRDVHVPLSERLLRIAGWSTKELRESVVGHPQAGRVVEVGHVQPERSVILEIDQLPQNCVAVRRTAIRGESHHLVLTRVHPESEIVGECAVQQAQRVRESNLAQHLYSRIVAERQRCRRPFANAVDGEDRGLLERRREKRARGVAEMVLREHEAAVPVDVLRHFSELPYEETAQKELFVDPERHRLREGGEAAWSETDVRLQQPLELEKWLFVKDYEIDVRSFYSRKLQTERDG